MGTQPQLVLRFWGTWHQPHGTSLMAARDAAQGAGKQRRGKQPPQETSREPPTR